MKQTSDNENVPPDDLARFGLREACLVLGLFLLGAGLGLWPGLEPLGLVVPGAILTGISIFGVR